MSAVQATLFSFWHDSYPPARMNSDELQVQVTIACLCAQRSFWAAEISLIRASSVKLPVSIRFAGKPVCHTLSFFATLVYCRYLYPTHLRLTTPLSTYEAPPCLLWDPHLPIQCQCCYYLFVLTCVLLIPLPNPGLGYSAAEKPDPSSLLAISPSLSLIAGLCCGSKWESKVNTWIVSDQLLCFVLHVCARKSTLKQIVKTQHVHHRYLPCRSFLGVRGTPLTLPIKPTTPK